MTVRAAVGLHEGMNIAIRLYEGTCATLTAWLGKVSRDEVSAIVSLYSGMTAPTLTALFLYNYLLLVCLQVLLRDVA